ncbi:phage tail assembly chaperone family protein, TAC [Halomonas sp. HP20-15]|uniref:phage tail assembly chaperone family protein, TAC n=1 Tax=Halomonas sp. HP20-15 TaxID=3085901 RepID=UPI002980FEDD|nr:phage tail assembly chaperone family protein, TAC [Halomonas sp. HP20-15]MDW5376841.1 phage tail assembly chaperone family protein, TAC [Halomonas sp. HP20-15]
MELSIESLQKEGAFTGPPVKRTVTWHQAGEEKKADVYVRPLSYHSATSDLATLKAEKSAAAGRIAACVCKADGTPVFTIPDITGEADPERGPLNGNLTMALLGLIGEVSGLGKTAAAPAKSPTKKRSGTSSS